LCDIIAILGPNTPPDVLLNMSGCLLLNGKAVEAAVYLDQAIKLEPDHLIPVLLGVLVYEG
jgi:hypothetical protein